MKSSLLRVAVYIDGSNFYYRLKELGIKSISRFDYLGLSKLLTGESEIISLRYYVGAVRAKPGDEKGQELRKNQQKLFAYLESQGFKIKTGFLMKSSGAYHEKGVDVKIATDLLVGAYEGIYDRAILLSSDTDLIPAINKVRHLGKKVEYVGFQLRPSFALLKNSTSQKLLTIEDVKKFAK